MKLLPRPVRGQRVTHAGRGSQQECSLYVCGGDGPCAAVCSEAADLFAPRRS